VAAKAAEPEEEEDEEASFTEITLDVRPDSGSKYGTTGFTPL
jgi:twitching motility protein PilU